MALAIKVENLSKAYQLGEIGTGSLSNDLQRWIAKTRGKEDPFLKIGETNDRTKKGTSNVVWSLKDVNFEIQEGKAVGIIGRNGAGKSTLLKLLSRVTSPTTGNFKVKGRIASLLEVGTGFHPELTGRDNIYLNGAILGMRKQEIKRKFDEIVAFSGVERYIDTPVKRYSSGMYVRLAFAVAAHLESEILIVDEVLAVGDADFQKKCLGKMDDVSKGEGRTILFVSHNMAAVRGLCDNCILLEMGKVKSIDTTDKIIWEYQGNFSNKNKWSGKDGDEHITITSTSITSSNNKNEIFNDEDIKIEIHLEVKKDMPEAGVGFNLISGFGYPVARAAYDDYNQMKGLKMGKYVCEFVIPKHTIASGTYEVNFDIAIPHVKRINSEDINLYIEIFPNGELGNKLFADNSPNFNSLIRTNWFTGLQKL